MTEVFCRLMWGVFHGALSGKKWREDENGTTKAEAPVKFTSQPASSECSSSRLIFRCSDPLPARRLLYQTGSSMHLHFDVLSRTYKLSKRLPSNIGLLLRMLWVAVCFHRRCLTICKHGLFTANREQYTHEICLTQECLQIARHLIWKQTTTHSLRNNNPMFDSNLWPNSFEHPSRPIFKV